MTMINKIHTFGKFLDQPVLIAKFEKSMPFLMSAGGALALGKIAHDVFQKTDDKNERKRQILSRSIVLTASIISALLAPKIASKVTNRTPLSTIEKVKEDNLKLINNFIEKNKPDDAALNILNKAKEKILSFKETQTLFEKVEDKDFLEKLIPDPVAVSSKDIIKEIGYLSVYGAVPVMGGVLGGITADSVTGEDIKKTIPDKIKEGAYQYLANIFMCNIGAAMGLGVLETMNVKSKSARAGAMIAGIILTGVIGGSKIANFISDKFIDKFAKIKTKQKERTPEPLDLFLHTDDIATVSVLSGLKWIEPALPVLYSVSGYRAGIGYRN
ncbi:MAG: hypothetical protein IJ877_07925 [Candidatus Gastranaerophilales bacterium]|nr:hypothetical protein [Candidatus Gastranaerophilales bacterium]